MTDFIRAFSKITKDDIKIAGGKGASLEEMMKAGFPVRWSYLSRQ
jgi:phosphoenolpyruvate synthase/pyruvate phosphate dikinase